MKPFSLIKTFRNPREKRRRTFSENRTHAEFESKIQARNLRYNPIVSISYDGEKNPGAIGTIKRFILDHPALRERAWQSYLESEISQTVIKRFITWIIGSGLRLQSEPMESQLNGVEIDREVFTNAVEDRFKLFAGSLMSTQNQQTNLHSQAAECLKNAILAGDCLCILRVRSGRVTSELVDGSQVQTPILDAKLMRDADRRGNIIRDGIELNDRQEHVAYYVRSSFREYQRIRAKGERTGTRMAFLVVGLRYRIKNVRGIPLISAVMELLSKLERYRESTVGSAEERQKIPYFIEHGQSSTGENPLRKTIANSIGLNRALQNDDSTVEARKSANLIAATTDKQVFNLPVDTTIKHLGVGPEANFKDFYIPNVNMVCAAIEIPPEVALSKYDSNFSSSRAALKDWEHTAFTKRENFAFQFYKPIYQLWLEVEAANGLINAPGFLEARRRRDWMFIEALLYCRFTGVGVPHIDPLKEVLAERQKLGPLGANAPLTTIERSTEVLNSGDFNSNIEKFSDEVQRIPRPEPEQPNLPPVGTEE